MKLTFTKKKLLLLVAGMLGTASLSQSWSQTSCGSATIPATMTTVSADSFICSGGNVGLSLSPTITNGGTSVTYQWQYATNAAGPWTNLGTASTTATYLDMNVTANRFYRCLVNCNNTLATTSSTISTTVTTPQTPTVVAGSRCGPGTVTLSGTPSTGATLQWYTAATGGAPVGSGNTFTTPYLTQNTTYYASSTIGGAAPPTWVGTTTTTTTGSGGNPFYSFYYGNRQQYLFTAAELTALGLSAGAITNIAFTAAGLSNLPLNGFKIRLGMTAATTITAWQTGLTDVYTASPSYTSVSGLNAFTLTTPFYWDGVSSLILETCFNNTTYVSGNGVQYHTTTSGKSLYYIADNSTVCTSGSPSTSTNRPNTRLTIVGGCASNRVPVVATVTPAPALDITVDSIICNDVTKAITLTTPATNFDQYTWAPATNLYTDAAGTIPYVTGTSATTVYVRTANSGALTYTVAASNTSTGCTAADTVNTFVQPGNISIIALLDTLCVSGNPQLSLVPSGTYKPNSIQWQVQSGATFNNIAGANGNTYTTATPINTATTYQALIKAVGTATCATPQKTINVATPVLTSSTGATRCGPGSVTLSGQASVGTVSWYQNPTGGIALATGNNYTTPYIPTTTTYYVTATTDLALPPTWIGTSTTTTSGTSGNPFYTGYYGSKQQYLYTPAELLGMGLTPGVITAIAFDVTGNTGLPMTNYTIKMKQITGNTLNGANFEMSGLTQVYTTPIYTPTIGVNNFVLATPFVWDGTSSLVIETCYNNTSYSGSHTVKYTTLSNSNQSIYYYADNTTVCPTTSGYTTTYRPNTQFTMIGKCELPRVPVVATITPGPALASNVDSVICGNAIKAMSVTTPLANYNQYVWSPATDLYTNAAGTIPYVAGSSASTVYVKSSTAGPKEYYLAASNPTCTGADTNKTWIQPTVVEVDAFPDTICISGSTDLSLIPANLYAPNSIQWQTNASGSYVNVATGGTTQTYTTPTINTNTGYRAQIKAMGTVCLNADKTVVIADPTLLSYGDSFRCGPGSVTLAATAGGNGVPKWYDVPMGGLALGSGNTFNTPPLSATQTFYVEAGMGGGGSGSPVWLGTATTTTTGSDGNPFYTFYYGNKQQYLYTAAELSALGLGAGSVLEMGFYVSSNTGMSMTNFTIKMGQTTATGLTAFVPNLTTVYSTPLLALTTVGERIFTLQNPFVWDGVSNLIIETCFNNTSYVSGNGVRYHTVPSTQSRRYYADNSTVCSNTAGTATTYRPNTMFKIQGGCTTNRVAVIAEIRETPVVNLGADRNICDDVNREALLSVNTQPAGSTYRWDNNVTTPDRTINASGTYYIDVTNSVGCTERDSVTINLLESPMVNLPDSARICIGGNTVLNPGYSGNTNTQYYWSTGSSQDSITVNAGGTYIVYATNPNNCSNSDTIVVVEEGYMPALSYVMSQNIGSNTFSFNVVGAQNVISYHWDFGDGTTSNAANPTHTFANVGTYFVTVRLNSICGEVTGSSSVHILTSTGIKDVEADKYVKLYPNPNTGEVVYLELVNDVKITTLEIYNVVGQRILVMDNFQPGSDKYTIALPAHLASGIYNVKMETSKGILTKKLEIVK